MNLQVNPKNPRTITDDKFKKLCNSIKEDSKAYFKDSIQVCNQCHCGFKDKQHRKFCSRNCYGQSLKLYKPCKRCGVDIPSNNGTRNNRVYCSIECQGLARRGVPMSKEWRMALSNGRMLSKKCHGSSLYNWKGGKSTQKLRNKIYASKRRSATKIDLDPMFLRCLIIAQRHKCFYCGVELNEYKALEHLSPLSRGGDNWNYNIVYSCKSCNSRKRNRTLEEWAFLTGNIWWCDKWDDIYTSTLIIQDRVKEKYGIQKTI